MKNQRYFEFVGGGSNKFWSVALAGTAVTVRFGRIGTDGQAKTRTHATGGDAKDEVESLVRAKLAKGYREKKPPAKTASSKVAGGKGGAASFAALEASLVPETTITIFTIRKRKMVGAGWEKAVRKATGLDRLPPSYLEFAARLRSVGEWIAQPKQKRLPKHLEVYVDPKLFAKSRKLLVTILDMAVRDYNQADEAAKWRGLVVFGTDSARSFFCWDPARVDKRGEPAIVLLDNEAELRVTTIAKDLYELMRSYRQTGDGDDADN